MNNQVDIDKTSLIKKGEIALRKFYSSEEVTMHESITAMCFICIANKDVDRCMDSGCPLRNYCPWVPWNEQP